MSEPASRHPVATLHGWGRHAGDGVELLRADLEALPPEVSLARGLGRSYGDASLPASRDRVVVNTRLADRILAFDPTTGSLRAEAGLSLATLNALMMPRGFFPPVTPGTKFVTLGGMVAADVHGKNQHVAGNIGNHVSSLRLLVADGRLVECSRTQHAELFAATIGGMGLTGVIVDLTLTMQRIPSPWIVQETLRIDSLDEYVETMIDVAQRYPFSVGWLDCLARGRSLGRGLLMPGRWAEPDEAKPHFPPAKRESSVPFDFPELALSRLSIGAFNELLYRSARTKRRTDVVTPERFWYPLDSVHEWYRMYGKRGFTQYQFVVPRTSTRGIQRVLEHIQAARGTPFLTVLKDFGREGDGTLSFPMPGLTLAIDLPIRDDTQQLVDALNEIVVAEGGRIYLAKDSFTRPEHFRAMEPRLHAFEVVRNAWDPDRRWRSALSRRLFGDPA